MTPSRVAAPPMKPLACTKTHPAKQQKRNKTGYKTRWKMKAIGWLSCDEL